jgi:hypothetical protein
MPPTVLNINECIISVGRLIFEIYAAAVDSSDLKHKLRMGCYKCWTYKYGLVTCLSVSCYFHSFVECGPLEVCCS